MRVTHLTLQNIRSYERADIEFSKGINLIVGPNNAGKSTIIHALLTLQTGLVGIQWQDLRLAAGEGKFTVSLADSESWFPRYGGFSEITMELKNTQMKRTGKKGDGAIIETSEFIPQNEPKNFIYPYLSKRKVTQFQESISAPAGSEVRADFSNLYTKVDRILTNPRQASHQLFVRACEDILGFPVNAVQTHNGKRGAYIVDEFQSIPLSAMGEGVMNIVGLLVDLCIARDKLFLIEEPENDIHPRALKDLLHIVAQKATENQFIITTHSNIVLKQLGGLPEAKVFSVSAKFDQNSVPTSSIEPVSNTPHVRRDLLESLGYELSDLDLWDAWLFLEESSAEKIIKAHLIPWFAPELRSKLNTFSAGGVNKVAAKFDDFNSLFVFLHLSPAYKNRVWVILDGGDAEGQIVKRLQDTYAGNGWQRDRFLQFGKHDFELYYPKVFAAEINTTLAEKNAETKRVKKKQLLEKVEQWIQKDEGSAKTAFAESAAEVIQKLQGVLKSIQ